MVHYTVICTARVGYKPLKFRHRDEIKQFSALKKKKGRSHILLYFTLFSLTNGILKLDHCPELERSNLPPPNIHTHTHSYLLVFKSYNKSLTCRKLQRCFGHITCMDDDRHREAWIELQVTDDGSRQEQCIILHCRDRLRRFMPLHTTITRSRVLKKVLLPAPAGRSMTSSSKTALWWSTSVSTLVSTKRPNWLVKLSNHIHLVILALMKDSSFLSSSLYSCCRQLFSNKGCLPVVINNQTGRRKSAKRPFMLCVYVWAWAFEHEQQEERAWIWVLPRKKKKKHVNSFDDVDPAAV